MNKNIFRSRTVIGAVCILLAVLVCFGITPLFNEGLKAQTEAVRVKAEVIPRGTYITADMVEVYTRGASGMEESVATSLDEVVGRYTDVELRKNTDVNTAWLSSEPLTQYEYLTRLNGSKVAISVTIPTFAKGGSGKVEAGDIIMLFATDKDTGETTQPPELKYVEVLAATQSSGADKEYQAPVENEEEENPEETLPGHHHPAGKQRTGPAFSSFGGIQQPPPGLCLPGARANAEKLPGGAGRLLCRTGGGGRWGEQSAGSPC